LGKKDIIEIILLVAILAALLTLVLRTEVQADEIDVVETTEICSVVETTTEATTVYVAPETTTEVFTTEKQVVQYTEPKTTEDELTTVRYEDISKLKELGTFRYYWYCREEYPHICNDGAPYLTKLETKPTDKTVAVDPNVIPLGSKLYINGEYYIAEDTGGAIKGNRIDINCATHSEALNNGTGYVKVFLVVE
jgi:3D (Asp-Asp-Asp) domain-containing protein